MIPFPFNENRFSFFVADHLLVGQLCTNPKSNWGLLSCLKVTQCSTSEIGDAMLYNPCSLPIQVMTTGPLPAPSKWIATNKRDVPRMMKTKFPATVMVFGVVSSECHIILHHIFEVCLKVNTKVYLNMLKSVVIPWCNQVAGGRPWVWQQVRRQPTSPKRPRFGFRRSATTLYPSLTVPLHPLDYFVWSYVENTTNMTSQNIKASLIAAIRRVFAELPPALVEKACSQYRIRIEVVIEAEGGYIK